jgi:hypothetical protein
MSRHDPRVTLHQIIAHAERESRLERRSPTRREFLIGYRAGSETGALTHHTLAR